MPERPVLLPDFAKTRENAHKKRTAAGLEILEALKRMVSPDQGGIWTDRAGWMLNCCKKWHKKKDACGVGGGTGSRLPKSCKSVQ